MSSLLVAIRQLALARSGAGPTRWADSPASAPDEASHQEPPATAPTESAMRTGPSAAALADPETFTER